MTPEIRRARYHIPSNAKRPPFQAHPLPVRRESSQPWDDPEPLSRAEVFRLFVYMLPAALIVLAGLWAFCVLMFTLVAGPGE